ncbi:MAG: MATE family efflux transporter [Anaerolineae bacterium]|nr:MATE family efflux transporter [Anaerolineae bacterium]
MMNYKPDQHPFLVRPNRTLMALSIPIILSLIAEPITGIVDTAFVAQLGAAPLAALGVGTTLLSTILWIFNFLGISTQTEVAHALGADQRNRAVEITSIALLTGIAVSLVLLVLGMITADSLSAVLGATGEVQAAANAYIRIRLFALPAVLMTLIGFGALRGLQDMRTPFLVAVTINGMNIALDALLVPRYGIAGAAWATVASQWVGAVWTLIVVIRGLGFIPYYDWAKARALVQVGGDLFLRTGLLTLFLLLTTRVANQISPEAGAAHQALRTVFLFSGFLTDGLGVTAQSLVGYFLGANRIETARYAAGLALRWGFLFGLLVTGVLFLSTGAMIALLVPPEAVTVFEPSWLVVLLLQPLAALAFVTDGIHWGTGDYAFIRNAMLVATACGTILIAAVDVTDSNALLWVWGSYIVFMGVRGVFGVMRVWPGFGRSPLRAASLPAERVDVTAG